MASSRSMIWPTRRCLRAIIGVVFALLSSTQAFLTGAPVGSLRIPHGASTSRLPSDSLAPSFATATPGHHARRAGAVTPKFMSAAETAVDQKGLVTVYHKETCPHCKKALKLLEEDYSLQVTRVNVLEGDDSDKKIKQMKTFSGRDTVPQIFFNSEHLGGNDDLQKLHADGMLEELVAKVRAEPPGMMKPTWYHPWY